MSKETLNLAHEIRAIEGYDQAVAVEGRKFDEAFLREMVVEFGTYIVGVAERIPTQDRGAAVDTQGRFFAALHWLLNLREYRGVPDEVLRKAIDLAGYKVGAGYIPEYEIREDPKGLVFKKRDF